MLLPQQSLITLTTIQVPTLEQVHFTEQPYHNIQHPSLGKGDEREVPDLWIKQKQLKKLPPYYTDTKPTTLNKAITIQKPNALGTPQTIYQVQNQVVMNGRKNNGLNM